MLTMFFTLFQVESGAEPLMGWVGPWPAPSFFIFYFYSCMYTYFCLGVYYITFFQNTYSYYKQENIKNK
jgi:hypothetical protein